METIVLELIVNYITKAAGEFFNTISKDDFKDSMERVFLKLEKEMKREYPDIEIEESFLVIQENIDILCSWIRQENILSVGPKKLNLNNFDGTKATKEQEKFVIESLKRLALEEKDLKNQIKFNINKDTNFLERELIDSRNKGIEIERQYDFPEGYIQRKIVSFKSSGEEIDSNRSLYEICLEENRIILLADAGMGKSTELECFSYLANQDESVKVVFKELSEYVDEEIEDFIDERTIENSNSIMIVLDGFDEIESKNINTFSRKIKRFLKKYSQVRVIISSRTNFYSSHNKEEKTKSSLEGFHEVRLSPIDEESMTSYVQREVGCNEKFFNKARENNMKTLISNPFFLVGLVQIYKEEQSFPKKEELMNRLIEHRYSQDINKYNDTENLRERKIELMSMLEKMSFGLKCLNKQNISELEYQDLFDYSERELLKYSGIWMKNKEAKWSFEHNNFKEFLAAKFLCAKSLEEIKSIITYGKDVEGVKPNWLNTLSFLVSVYEGNDIVEWLVEEYPTYVIDFELNTLDDGKRQDIVIGILEEHKKKKMWISWNVKSIEKLSLFGQGEKLIQYLREEIKTEKYFKTQSNCISLLRYFTDFAGMENDIRQCLIRFCKGNARSDEKKLAISVFSNRCLFTEDSVRQLIDLLSREDDTILRIEICELLLNHNLQNKYVDFVLESFDVWHEGICNGEIKIKLKSVMDRLIEKMSEYFAVKKILNHIKKIDNRTIMWGWIGKTLDPIFKTAEELYKNGCEEIFIDVMEVFVDSMENAVHQLANPSKSFLENMGKIYDVYIFIITNCQNYRYRMLLLEEVMDNDCIDDFINKYVNNELENRNFFVEYCNRRHDGDYRYLDMIYAIKEKENIILEPKVKIDYFSIEIEGKQKYFNALFDKKEYLKLVEEFIGKFMPEGEFVENLFYELDNKNYLERIYCDLRVYENNREEKLRQMIRKVNWELFLIDKIILLLSNEYENLEIEEEQKLYIKRYCEKELEKHVLKKNIAVEKNGYSVFQNELGEFVNNVEKVVFLSEFFEFEYEEQVYLDMLMIPAFFFNDSKYDDFGFPKYITARIDLQKLKSQIVFNLENKHIAGELACQYMYFCKENNMDNAIRLALEIWSDLEYKEYSRSKAFEYIVAIKGRTYIYEKMLVGSDEIQFKIIAKELLEECDSRVIQRMIIENKKSNDGKLYLKELIYMNSEYGLKKYHELAKQINRLPDYAEDGTIPSITDAISNANDISNLSIIMELCELAMHEGFKDTEGWGLYNSVYRSIKLMAQSDALKVRKNLKELEEKNLRNERIVSFCNQMIEDIKTELYSQISQSWSIKELKDYFRGLKSGKRGDMHMGNKYNIVNNGEMNNLAIGDNATVNINESIKKDIESMLPKIRDHIDLNSKQKNEIKEIQNSIKINRWDNVKTQLMNFIVGVVAGCAANGVPEIINELLIYASQL